MSFGLAAIRIPTKRHTEKFFRKLAGMTDLEDALKKLDRLTQEEARMANVEVLRITQSIRDGVKVVDGKVEDVGDKVQSVDDKVQVVIDGTRGLSARFLNPFTSILSDGKHAAEKIGVKIEDVGDKVQCVDEKVQVVDEKVQVVDEKVQIVDEKVQVVIDGAQGPSIQWLTPSNICTFRRQAGKSSGARSKFGHSTSSQRHRRN